MGDRIDIDFDQLPDDLKLLAQTAEQAAIARAGHEIELLALLRLLEQLHSQIRDDWFQASLPTNRQRLYALLRDIEVNGGWPYIQRMRLHTLVKELQGELELEATTLGEANINHPEENSDSAD
ncbi:MAG: hypothetical protein F6K00_10155 [Leptolyngbya sp. SIOISBB]|nr:hypothetical protein [Leptolyngbya sp. SIOISBB]